MEEKSKGKTGREGRHSKTIPKHKREQGSNNKREDEGKKVQQRKMKMSRKIRTISLNSQNSKNVKYVKERILS